MRELSGHVAAIAMRNLRKTRKEKNALAIAPANRRE